VPFVKLETEGGKRLVSSGKAAADTTYLATPAYPHKVPRPRPEAKKKARKEPQGILRNFEIGYCAEYYGRVFISLNSLVHKEKARTIALRLSEATTPSLRNFLQARIYPICPRLLERLFS
jgi:hypothetical protein